MLKYRKQKTKTKAKTKQRETGLRTICLLPVYCNLVIIFYKTINIVVTYTFRFWTPTEFQEPLTTSYSK